MPVVATVDGELISTVPSGPILPAVGIFFSFLFFAFNLTVARASREDFQHPLAHRNKENENTVVHDRGGHELV